LRGGAGGSSITVMPANRSLTLHLESRTDGELIAGWLCDERGEKHRFASWLGLLTLLERARPTAADEPLHGASHAGTGRRETRNEYNE
jgi:hypothetical protein